jgi:hypothetical protein
MINELVNKVICPCCHSVSRGGRHGKPTPIKEIQKSYKELGLSKTPTKGTSESKKQVKGWLDLSKNSITKSNYQY